MVPSGGALSSTTDPVSQGLVAAILVLVFILLALEKAHRVLVVLGAVALLWGITYATPWRLISFEGAKAALDLNVLFLLAAMMATVGVLKTTGVFPWAVAHLLRRAGGRPGPIQSMIAWFTGAVSAMADNVTTVVFVTPMAYDMARETRVRPVVYLLPMIMAANIGGTATLIGDPPNIMIGSGASLGFLDFLRDLTVPVLWMMVVLGWMARRRYRHDLAAGGGAGPVEAPALRDPLLLRWSLLILTLMLLGFVTHGLTGVPVAVPAVIGATAMLLVQDVLYVRRHRPSHTERVHGLVTVIEQEIEWPTLSFFAFLFITVGAAVETGLVDTLAGGLADLIGRGQVAFGLSPEGTLLLAALTICWASGVLSALIDNIPFVAVAIPIVGRLTAEMPGHPNTLWWALALGACLGGNGTAVGASANVTALGLAERAGTRISFLEFTRFGALVTAASLAIASLFLTGYVYLGDGMTLRLGLLGLGALAVAGRLAALAHRRIAPGA